MVSICSPLKNEIEAETSNTTNVIHDCELTSSMCNTKVFYHRNGNLIQIPEVFIISHLKVHILYEIFQSKYFKLKFGHVLAESASSRTGFTFTRAGSQE